MRKTDKLALLIVVILFGFGFSINFISTSLFPPPPADESIHRVILISIDSGNPEYLSADMMPKLYSEIMARGAKFKNALTALAAETQQGHTSMLTGAYPNSTGIIGNGYYDNSTGKTTAVVLNESYRLAETIIEALDRTNPSLKTAFLSGKWRLPPLLSNTSDLVFTSSYAEKASGIPFPVPPGYEEKLGRPLEYLGGDLVDVWVMNALIEVIRTDDPEFIFVNLAGTDDIGHYSGGVGDYSSMIRRQLRELDNLFMRLFTELRAIGEFDNTLFAITADHGMTTIEDIIDMQTYMDSRGIGCHIHAEGGSGFVYLDNSADLNTAVGALQEHPDVVVVVPYTNYSQYPYNLDMNITRVGHIYFSTRAHTVLSLHAEGLGNIPVNAVGAHGGIAEQDILMAWMGPNITRMGYEIPIVPHVADVVPTICHIMGWTAPNNVDGRILYEIIE
ncbi:MAG: alkaline phosphatase family protein [Candidatus Helarchaeota archaeon]|nr:alkaline phosphatase family protein [Candidatus Helarchaeota archaeon]